MKSDPVELKLPVPVFRMTKVLGKLGAWRDGQWLWAKQCISNRAQASGLLRCARNDVVRSVGRNTNVAPGEDGGIRFASSALSAATIAF